MGWTSIARAFWKGAPDLVADLTRDGTLDAAGLVALALVGALALAPLVVLALVLLPVARREPSLTAPAVAATGRPWWVTWTPGCLDLAGGRPFRGYLTLLGASLLPITVAGHAAAAAVLQATAAGRCPGEKDAPPMESVETRTHLSGR